MVTFKSTVPEGLPLDIGVEVKKVSLNYFEHRAGRFPLDFLRTPRYSNFVNFLRTYVEWKIDLRGAA